MKTTPDTWTVQELINLRENGDLRVNPEYQRGAVWSESQMRLLIDSIFRGYQMPLIYLREEEREIRKGKTTTHYDIIDGQQRINALCSFVAGAVIEESRSGTASLRPFKPLYNPSDEADKAMFPVSIQSQECAWGGKIFENLDSDIRDKFLKKEVRIALMTDCSDDEARDLFIRLQGGSDLRPQEIRDAWPGNFRNIVLGIGGKPQNVKYPGHDFFRVIMKAKPKSDRGKTRQLVAQLLVLFLAQKDRGRDYFVQTKSDALNDAYRQYAGLDIQSQNVLRFRSILDKLLGVFGDGKRPPLKGHDAIHLILFVDMLMEGYAPKWSDSIVVAFDKFAAEVRKAKQYKDFPKEESKDFQDVWTYDLKTRTSSDAPATIKQRHEIYKRLMLQFLGNDAVEQDAQRGFTPLQRETIYFRDKKKCHVCKQDVKWEDADIHHIKQHSEGGETTLKNGVLVHRKCHRKLHRQKSEGCDDD